MTAEIKAKPGVLLSAKIAAAARALSVAVPGISTGEGKTYEAWVTLEIAAGLKAVGFEVEARDHRDQPTRAFKFRGAPGYIRPASSPSSNEPCHFAISPVWGPQLEMHASVRHRGLSGDTHELDVSVVHKRAADVCRALPNGGPYTGRRIMGLELKQFAESGHLDKAIPRALLGVAVDLDPGMMIKGLGVQTAQGREAWFFGSPSGEDYRLLTTAMIRPASVSYLESYGIAARQGVAPSYDVAIDEIVHAIAMIEWG